MAGKMDIKKWYGRSLSLPAVKDTQRFYSFLVGGVGLVNSILSDNIGNTVGVAFEKVPSAYADFYNKRIVINRDFLTGKIDDSFNRLNAQDTITMILGIIVHEAAHFAYSAPTLEPYMHFIRDNSPCSYDEQVAANLGNIVEDIFIEAEIDRAIPSISWMLDGVNNQLFDRTTVKAAIANAQGIEDAPGDLKQVFTVLNLLILAKTRDAVEASDYLQDLFEDALSATTTYELEDRYELALDIYNKLMTNVDASECGGGDGCEGKEESEGGGDKGFGGGDDSEDGDILKRLKGIMDDGSGIPALKDTYETKRLNEMLEEEMDSRLSVRDDADGSPFVAVEKTLPSSDLPLNADARYERLAEIARQRASVNRPYGLDKNRGSHIRKLHRIATDQKIFAETVTMSGYKPMQVIILVDASGSMKSKHGGKRCIMLACEAALGAAHALVNARCEVAVYAHTADTTALKETLIYQAKSFQEPIAVLGGRLATLAHCKADLEENRDGYAVDIVSRKFNNPRLRRLMIVISDGAPLASNYNGYAAIRHTERSVKAARRRGVDILSISIEERARYPNDTIYGAENNIYNQDPNVITQIISSLLK